MSDWSHCIHQYLRRRIHLPSTQCYSCSRSFQCCLCSYRSCHTHGSPSHTHQYLQVEMGSLGYIMHMLYSTHVTTSLHVRMGHPFPLQCIGYLTCAVRSISFKSIIARAFKAANHISTGGIHSAVVCIQFALINICYKKDQQLLLSAREGCIH